MIGCRFLAFQIQHQFYPFQPSKKTTKEEEKEDWNDDEFDAEIDKIDAEFEKLENDSLSDKKS